SLQGDTISDLYRTRANYIRGRYGETEDNYYRKVVAEFDKLTQAPDGSEFNLWFGYDLFCQVNLWYIISLLNDPEKQQALYIIYPTYLTGEDIWNDFGGADTADLTGCYNKRMLLDPVEMALGTALWNAYKNADLASLDELSRTDSPCFPYLREVCKAHLERFPADGVKGRPEQAVEQLIKEGPSDFSTVFHKFSRREGIYGFSDLQVKQIFDSVKDDSPDSSMGYTKKSRFIK
ncbi:MAG TPA: hypothetical protein VLZ28_00050, partial [Daejeonella sp.]|nr:hypothetical protein [Daejeonella sp.]